MTALIFGSTGQDGRYLRKHLAAKGVNVFGVSRSGDDACIDVNDAGAVRKVIREVRPDYLFHLAATSSTAREHLWANHASISTGTLAILDAVEYEAPNARVLLAGSGLQFVNEGQPIHEECPLDHSSPYTVARNHSLFAARYFRQRGLKVCFAWLFHHDSPERSNQHLNMKIAEAAARHAEGVRDKLLIGDLTAEKEFGFAGDIIEALTMLVQQDSLPECVVGTGAGHTVLEWVQACYGHVGLDWRDFVEPDPHFKNPFRRLVSRPERLFGIGWQPHTSFKDLATLMMDEAIRRVAKKQFQIERFDI